jgi:biopolymer transport protein ExbD
MDSLGPRLQAIIGSKPDTTVYVRADKDINYGVFAEVLGELQSNGITKIGLVNDSKDTSTPAGSSGAKPAGGATQQPKTK